MSRDRPGRHRIRRRRPGQAGCAASGAFGGVEHVTIILGMTAAIQCRCQPSSAGRTHKSARIASETAMSLYLLYPSDLLSKPSESRLTLSGDTKLNQCFPWSQLSDACCNRAIEHNSGLRFLLVTFLALRAIAIKVYAARCAIQIGFTQPRILI